MGWDQRGSLHLARTHDRMLQFRKMKSQSGKIIFKKLLNFKYFNLIFAKVHGVSAALLCQLKSVKMHVKLFSIMTLEVDCLFTMKVMKLFHKLNFSSINKFSGVVDKDKLRHVLLSEAIKRGVTVVENCAVEKIIQKNRKVDSVQTSCGNIECVYFVSYFL